MNLSNAGPQPNFNGHIFTREKYLAHGDRLHANTAIDLVVNSVTAYVILKHSTNAMGIYKYYILSTLTCSFLMDFHTTFIYGPFILLPSPVMCGSGIVARHFGYLWGQLMQYVSDGGPGPYQETRSPVSPPPHLAQLRACGGRRILF